MHLHKINPASESHYIMGGTRPLRARWNPYRMEMGRSLELSLESSSSHHCFSSGPESESPGAPLAFPFTNNIDLHTPFLYVFLLVNLFSCTVCLGLFGILKLLTLSYFSYCELPVSSENILVTENVLRRFCFNI